MNTHDRQVLRALADPRNRVEADVHIALQWSVLVDGERVLVDDEEHAAHVVSQLASRNPVIENRTSALVVTAWARA